MKIQLPWLIAEIVLNCNFTNKSLMPQSILQNKKKSRTFYHRKTRESRKNKVSKQVNTVFNNVLDRHSSNMLSILIYTTRYIYIYITNSTELYNPVPILTQTRKYQSIHTSSINIRSHEQNTSFRNLQIIQ